MYKIRRYQHEAETDIYSAWNASAINVALVLPTGSGKTVIFSDMIRQHKGAACAIAHRQELVSQISLALAREEVRHRIIGPQSVIKLCVSLHMAELKKSFYNPSAPCAVAGIDTLIRRMDDLKQWGQSVTLWVQDECFPAGTLIDGRRIESLKVGDYVTAYDTDKNIFVKKKILTLYKNPAPAKIYKLCIKPHNVIYCTENHPILTRRGWVPANQIIINEEVLTYELPHMRKISKKIGQFNENISIYWKSILQQIMRLGIQKKNIFGNYGAYKSEICFNSNEEKQSNVQKNLSRKNEKNTITYRASSIDTRRKRSGSDTGRKNLILTFFRYRFQKSINCFNWFRRCFNGLPTTLQNRLWESSFKNSNRSGRKQSQYNFGPRKRQEKNAFSIWQRVDSIKIQKWDDYEFSTGCHCDGYVYNIEVEDLHTYIANGIIVHNCHHLLRENKWGKGIELFPNARGLGVTATPLRADGKGLGRHADGVFDKMVVGPTSRELIKRGYLTDYRIFAPNSDIDLSKVPVSQVTGDYSPVKLKVAVRKSRIIGDVVDHYLKIAPGKLGVTFATDVETASDIANKFNSAGVPAAVVSAETPDRERIAAIRKFKDRRLLQLVNVDLFGEGFDLPAIEVVSMARPTKSYGLYVQQFGRGLRLMIDDKIYTRWEIFTDEERRDLIARSIKPHAIIIDHVHNVDPTRGGHGLPDTPRRWTLDRRAKRDKDPGDLIPIRACPSCTRVYSRLLLACPYCGFKPIPVQRSSPDFVDGDLCELDAVTLAAMRGDVAAMDMHKELYRQQLAQKHVPLIGQQANVKRHVENQEMQQILRESIALWGGYQRHFGRLDRESYKLFYFKFGIDVLSAQALKARDAALLTEKINEDIRAAVSI